MQTNTTGSELPKLAGRNSLTGRDPGNFGVKVEVLQNELLVENDTS